MIYVLLKQIFSFDPHSIIVWFDLVNTRICLQINISLQNYQSKFRKKAIMVYFNPQILQKTIRFIYIDVNMNTIMILTNDNWYISKHAMHYIQINTFTKRSTYLYFRSIVSSNTKACLFRKNRYFLRSNPSIYFHCVI